MMLLPIFGLVEIVSQYDGLIMGFF